MLKAPFPWFGGKSRVADLVWDRFGNVPNYVEPFAGSLAVLLMRPHEAKNETVNDKDAYLSNFWRALQAKPEEVAYFADWPVSEADLHARHQWLVDQADFREKMLTNPEFFDAKIAGWWVWGISQWIGSGWCSKPEWRGRGNGSRTARGIHRQQPIDKVWRKRPVLDGERGAHRVSQQLPYLSSDQGVHAKRPRLGGGGRGVQAKRPLVGKGGVGVHRSRPDISGDGNASDRGIFSQYATDLEDYMAALSEGLRRVRVCCGDWKRVLGPSPTTKIGLTGVFLDPPYSVDERADIYNEESRVISHDVRDWALQNAHDPQLRIALCGYEGEHDMPSDWETVYWKANGGFANQKSEGSQGKRNAHRERIWFSPACLRPGLFSFTEKEEPGTAIPGFDYITSPTAKKESVF